MAEDSREDWKQLCSQASVEKDPKKLLEIIAKLEKALDRRNDRMKDQVRDSA